MRRHLVAAGSRGFILGLNGGVDSAVALRLAQLAAPGATLGAILTCHSDPRDDEDAAVVATHFSAAPVRVELSSAYDALVATLQLALKSAPKPVGPSTGQPPASDRLPLASVKSRLRMTTLYYMADGLNYMVVGTSNRSALAIGAFTKHGDGGCDLLPLGGLAQGEVHTMASELGVPPSILGRPSSGDRWIGQTDEQEMGFSYAELERYLNDGPETVPPALAMKIERLIRSSDHKRQLPPMPDPE